MCPLQCIPLEVHLSQAEYPQCDLTRLRYAHAGAQHTKL